MKVWYNIRVRATVTNRQRKIEMIIKKLVEREVEVKNTELRTITVYEYNGVEHTPDEVGALANEDLAKRRIIDSIQEASSSRYINGAALRQIPYWVWESIHNILHKQIEFKKILDSDLTNDE